MPDNLLADSIANKRIGGLCRNNDVIVIELFRLWQGMGTLPVLLQLKHPFTLLLQVISKPVHNKALAAPIQAVNDYKKAS